MATSARAQLASSTMPSITGVSTTRVTAMPGVTPGARADRGRVAPNAGSGAAGVGPKALPPAPIGGAGATAAGPLGLIGCTTASPGLIGCTKTLPGALGRTVVALPATNGAGTLRSTGAGDGTPPGSISGAPVTRTGAFNSPGVTIRTGIYLLGVCVGTVSADNDVGLPLPANGAPGRLIRLLGVTMRTRIVRGPTGCCTCRPSVLAESLVPDSSLASLGLTDSARSDSLAADSPWADSA